MLAKTLAGIASLAAAGTATGQTMPAASPRQSLSMASISPRTAVPAPIAIARNFRFDPRYASPLPLAEVRDRYDVRALRLEAPRRRGTSPVAGLQLNLNGDMNATLGVTGALRAVMPRTIVE